MPIKEIFGLISTLLMIFSRGIYFTSIFKGRTKPHIFSWIIWGTISSIGVAAQIAEHAGPGAWARLVSAATCFLVAGLAWKVGEKHITRGDWITFVVALCAIPLWVMTKTPVYSVILVCVIDTIGYFPTIRKSWHKPHQEVWSGYVASSLCAFFAVLAVENYTLSTWLYSAVLAFSNAAMALFLVLRRRHILPV